MDTLKREQNHQLQVNNFSKVSIQTIKRVYLIDKNVKMWYRFYSNVCFWMSYYGNTLWISQTADIMWPFSYFCFPKPLKGWFSARTNMDIALYPDFLNVKYCLQLGFDDLREHHFTDVFGFSAFHWLGLRRFCWYNVDSLSCWFISYQNHFLINILCKLHSADFVALLIHLSGFTVKISAIDFWIDSRKKSSWQGKFEDVCC